VRCSLGSLANLQKKDKKFDLGKEAFKKNGGLLFMIEGLGGVIHCAEKGGGVGGGCWRGEWLEFLGQGQSGEGGPALLEVVEKRGQQKSLKPIDDRRKDKKRSHEGRKRRQSGGGGH